MLPVYSLSYCQWNVLGRPVFVKRATEIPVELGKDTDRLVEWEDMWQMKNEVIHFGGKNAKRQNKIKGIITKGGSEKAGNVLTCVPIFEGGRTCCKSR